MSWINVFGHAENSFKTKEVGYIDAGMFLWRKWYHMVQSCESNIYIYTLTFLHIFFFKDVRFYDFVLGSCFGVYTYGHTTQIFTTTDANQAPILFLWECEYIYKAPYHIYVLLFRISWFPSTPKRLKDFFCFLVLPV